MKGIVDLSSPWEQVHHALLALFAKDPYITVEGIDDDMVLTIVVSNMDKFNAMVRVLKTKYDFGNVKLKINVINNIDEKHERDTEFMDDAEALGVLFEGNPLFARIDKTKQSIIPVTYNFFCVFKKKVLQYYNDDISGLNGMKSILAQDIAREVFEVEDVSFCTDLG